MKGQHKIRQHNMEGNKKTLGCCYVRGAMRTVWKNSFETGWSSCFFVSPNTRTETLINALSKGNQ